MVFAAGKYYCGSWQDEASSPIPQSCMLSCSVVSGSLWPHGLWPSRFLCPRDSPGKNTGVGCHFLLQGIFPAQGLNPHLWPLLHCRQILCHWATPEAPDTSMTSPILCCISKDVGRKEENMWVLKAIYTFIHQEGEFEICLLILDMVFTLQDYPVAPNWKETLILVISCDFWAVKITSE